MAYKLTKEKIVQEIVKSGKKPVYFINTYCKIPHPGKGLIPFKTYDFQGDLVDNLALHRFIVVLKARQLGISTITAAYIAWLVLDMLMGAKVSEESEIEGLDKTELGIEAYPDFSK